MKTTKHIFGSTIIALFLLTVSCVPAPEPINYGKDLCAYCLMSIVDKKFGAELVTDKGKVYKFDAIECMVNYDAGFDKPVKYYLVNAYDMPGELELVDSCHFLISESVPSPMGAYLSAYKEPEIPKQIIAENGGSMLIWSELRAQLISHGIVH